MDFVGKAEVEETTCALRVKNTFIEISEGKLPCINRRQRCRSADGRMETDYERSELAASSGDPSPKAASEDILGHVEDCTTTDGNSSLADHEDMGADTSSRLSEMDDSVDGQQQGLPHDCVTIMIRNIPCKVTQEEFLADVIAHGFDGLFDFLYLPINQRLKRPRGFAFVNFLRADIASRFYQTYHGKVFSDRGSSKTLIVRPAVVQGLAAITNHFEETEKEKARPRNCRPVFVGKAEATAPRRRGNRGKKATTESKAACSAAHQPAPTGPVVMPCQQCRFLVMAGWHFCPRCGATV